MQYNESDIWRYDQEISDYCLYIGDHVLLR